MIEKIEFDTYAGTVKEEPTTYAIKFFFKIRKTPAILWVSSDINIKQLVYNLIDFIKLVMTLEDA